MARPHLRLVETSARAREYAPRRTHWALRSGAALILLGIFTLCVLMAVNLALKTLY
jgi:hypothetical protein